MGHFFKKIAWVALFMALMAPVGVYAQEGFEEDPWEQDCDLPAPDSLWFFDITPYSITAGWMPVGGAAEYCLSILEVSTGNISYFSTNQAEFVFTGLLPGTEYAISVGATLCSGGSCNYGDPENTRTWIVIGDVIIQRSCSPGNMNGPATFSGVVSFSLNTGVGDVLYFHVEADNDPSVFHEFALYDDVNNELVLQTVGIQNVNLPNPPNGGSLMTTAASHKQQPAPFYEIKNLLSPTVAHLEFEIDWKIPVKCTYGNGVCMLERQSKPPAPQVHATPVPFDGHLSLRWEVDAPAAAHAELYDMQGRLVHRSQAQNGSVYWPTDHLPPGIYILHTDTDGVREVRKLVKTK